MDKKIKILSWNIHHWWNKKYIDNIINSIYEKNADINILTEFRENANADKIREFFEGKWFKTISSNSLDKIGELIKQFEIKNDYIKELDKNVLLEIIKRKYEELSENIIDYDKEIKKLQKKQDNLLDMSLEWQISKEIYLRKNNEIEEEIRELKSRKNNIKNDDFLKKTQSWLELAGSFYTSYFRWNKELKTEIIKKLRLELFIDTKKELSIAENPLLESSKILNFSFGTPKGNWTPVPTVRGLCPSH